MPDFLTYSDNTKDWVKNLERHGIQIQRAVAQTLNLGASFVSTKYKAMLRSNFKIRNLNFTLGAIRIMKSHALRSSGKLRPLQDMNARVGVDNMKGGKLHYLAEQETGKTVHGSEKAGGRVPIPLVAARGSGSDMRPVAPRYRMQTAKIAELAFLNTLNPRQQYGALRDRGLRKNIRKGEPLEKGTLYMTNLGIFDLARKKNRVTAVRNTEQTRIIIRGRHLFEQATKSLTQKRMADIFIMLAKKFYFGK